MMSTISFEQSAMECTDSESIDDDPVNTAAASLAMATPMLAMSAAFTAAPACFCSATTVGLVSPDALSCAWLAVASNGSVSDGSFMGGRPPLYVDQWVHMGTRGALTSLADVRAPPGLQTSMVPRRLPLRWIHLACSWLLDASKSAMAYARIVGSSYVLL